MKNGNGNGKIPNGLTPKVRCAIYTRKSTEEGLDQEFNSLDAQREAAEAYIASQMHNGWIALPDQYNDGGYSGSNMERPGLKKLLGHVQAGYVDSIVTYKVDRLSRSLLDFARIIDLLEKHGVSFVSVTQQFNTATSMGRLSLHVLLSFAVYEREIISERIRDKVAASKRKGKYCGGMPVLGYDVDRVAKKLVINPTEAKLVRHIFRRFVQVGSATLLAKELNRQSHRTKEWVTAKGVTHAGVAWNKMHLYRMFNNRLYIGEVAHKDQHYPGEHEAIVTRDVFDRVQAILEENYRCRANRARTKTPALLKGLIRCGHCDCSMGPTFTKKDGKTYRYYVCIQATKKGWDTCPVKNVAAGEIEDAVIDQLRAVFRSPELIAATYRATTAQREAEITRMENERGDLKKHLERESDPAVLVDTQNRITEIDHLLRSLRKHIIEELEVADALRQLDPFWDELFPVEQARIVQLLIDRVVVNPDGITVRFRSDGLSTIAVELDADQETANE